MVRTVLVTTCWLDDNEYYQKTDKWLKHYHYLNGVLQYNNIILLDNASSFEQLNKLTYGKIIPQRFTEYLPRTSHLEYPYLWRAVHFFQNIFKEYDKIIYMDNDFYLISDNAINYVNNFKTGWGSFYCNKHNFPETGIQILTKDCVEYKDFVNLKQEDFIKKYNGSTMETTLPLTSINKILTGDRYSELKKTKQEPGWDFSAQTPLEMEITYDFSLLCK